MLPMKFMIGVDCDGVAGVVGEAGRGLSASRDYGFSRGQATREADAAARALFDAGARRVVVWDNHGSGANLEYDRLDPRCELAIGEGFGGRWPGLDETFTAVLMIGYHAMEGTAGGVLAHTYSSPACQWIKVNGQEVGEIALDAAVAGERGAPVILVASDEAGCAEARRFLPWAETVSTKRGLGRNCAFSKHPLRAAEEIHQAVRLAASRLAEMKPFTFPPPIRMELRCKHVLQACKGRLRRKGWRLAGLRALRRTLANMREWNC
jgi:D-amino peptidase